MAHHTFKPPLLRNVAKPITVDLHRPAQEQPVAILQPDENDGSEDEVDIIKAALPLVKARDGETPVARRPPALTFRPVVPGRCSEKRIETSDAKCKFSVLWRKPSTKKHKTWDGDGILVLSQNVLRLENERGHVLGKIAWTKQDPPSVGIEISVGARIVLIDSVLKSVPCGSDMKEDEGVETREVKAASSISRAIVPASNARSNKRSLDPEVGETEESLRSKRPRMNGSSAHKSSLELGPTKVYPRVLSTGLATKFAKFKTPLLVNTVQDRSRSLADTPTPRHDPNANNALVMKRPSSTPQGKRIVDVVVDPALTQHLRPHQREGVSFLYECVMGLRSSGGEGAILADEMGLGKTLQTIALIWTLLKQNPIYEDSPVVRKALVVCPVTLVANWRKEFAKWLGLHRIGIYVADNDKKLRVSDFTKGKAYQVMIIGYEKLCQIQDELQDGAGIDLVIADEGHRLKGAQSQAAAAIRSLGTERRILLTGTPLQNNLGEYFALVDLVNPGILGKASTFKRKFEDVINAGQQPDAISKKRNASNEKSRELAEITNDFILRRTSDVIANLLPSKNEYVLYCKPETSQLQALRNVVSHQSIEDLLRDRHEALHLLHVMKQLCNAPLLGQTALKEKSDEPQGHCNASRNTANDLRINTSVSTDIGVKLRVLKNLLQSIRKRDAEEKVVIVSGYTVTLDLIERHLCWPSLRLDGSVAAAKRGALVDLFNRSKADRHFAFLLSARAGGVGLNLIGANRLILFDSDWNPATDLQAMARIHRDGQKRACYIYRLLVRGALDEKIFQRQVSKMELAGEILESKPDAKTFSQDELRDLFTIDESSACLTHDLLGCSCGGLGVLSDAAIDDTTNQKAEEVPAECSEDSDVEVGPRGRRGGHFKPASEVDFTAGSNGVSKKLKGTTLMLYRHIDPAAIAAASGPTGVSLNELLEDDVLGDCLGGNSAVKGAVSFVFAKRHGGMTNTSDVVDVEKAE